MGSKARAKIIGNRWANIVARDESQRRFHRRRLESNACFVHNIRSLTHTKYKNIPPHMLLVSRLRVKAGVQGWG